MSEPDPIMRELAALRAEVTMLSLLVRSMILQNEPVVSTTAKELPVQAAAHDAGVSHETMRRWASKHKIGRYRGGRLMIDAAKLADFLANGSGARSA